MHSTFNCHFKHKKVALAAALVLLLSSVPALPLENAPVSLYLDVEKGDGLVQGLTGKDFRLYEDGKAQDFRLEPPETPATIAVLLEFSQSSWMFYDDIDSAMRGLLNTAPDGDWYALATFSNDLQVQADFTKNIGKIRMAYEDLAQPQWDEVNIYDAIYSMLNKMSLMHGRRELIVIASGFDSFSRHSLDDVQKKAESTNITIFGIGLGSNLRGAYQPYLSGSQEMDELMAQNFLRSLADETGGESWFPNEVGAYNDIIKGVFQILANQYRLVYNPPVIRDGKLHKIEVDAFQVVDDHRTDFKVRVRKGWRFE
jgi:VWFA-related protein